MSKAQVSTSDFFIAISIFLVLMIALLINLNKYPVRLNEEINKNDMLTTAYQISDSFVKTPGVPSKWENNVSSLRNIGLAKGNKILSSNKVNSFLNLNYNTTKAFMNYYDFYFKILYYNSSDTITYGSYFNGTSSITTRRYVTYNDQRAIMELTLWK